MTLVIAVKKADNVYFVSDSRISFGEQGKIDIGIKIFSNPTRVFSSTDSLTNKSTLDYEYRVGLAVVGGTVNSYLIKDTIYEILQNVQHTSIDRKFSFSKIAELVFKVYRKTTEDLYFLKEASLCTILLGGYCLEQNRIRLFKFEPFKDEYDVWDYRYSEFLVGDGIEFFGAASVVSYAKKLYEENPTMKPLKILKETIQDESVPSVGGGMQFGEFYNRNFRILGIADYAVDEEGRFKEHLHTLRGLTLYKGDFAYNSSDLHINYMFVRAFEDEIEEILNRDLDDWL